MTAYGWSLFGQNYPSYTCLPSVGDSEDKLSSEESESSSVGESEESEPSSTEDSEEEETDPRVRKEVGEIVKAFSTMAVGNDS